MGGNNILTRSAMDTLEELSDEFPELSAQVGELARQFAPVPGAIMALTVDMATVKGSVIALTQRVEDEPLRCPMREAAILLPLIKDMCEELKADVKAEKVAVNDRLKEHGEEIAGIKSTMKWLGGGLATFAAAITGLVELVKSALAGP